MSDGDFSKTMIKGLEVLSCFEDGSSGLTLADMSRKTGHDRATTRRLCFALEKYGYLNRDETKYALSPKVLGLAGGFLNAGGYGRVIQPMLEQCAVALDNEVALAVRSGNSALYVAQARSPGSRISFGMTVGSLLPLLPTAVGRVVLSESQPGLKADDLKDLPHRRYTDDTQTDMDGLLGVLKKVRNDHYSLVYGEYELGICGLAVPVFKEGRMIAALGTNKAIAKAETEEFRDKSLDALHRTAAELALLDTFSHW